MSSFPTLDSPFPSPTLPIMELATSLAALVLLLTPDLGARFLPGALALSVPHYHGSLIPRQTNTTTGLDNGATCTFDPECLSLFCRGITCVDPSTLVGQVQDGDECFDNASCSGLGSVSTLQLIRGMQLTSALASRNR